MSIEFRVFRAKPPEQPREGDALVKGSEVLYYKTGQWHTWILPPLADLSIGLALHAVWLNWRAEEARISRASAWSPSSAADKQGYLRALREAQMNLKMSLDFTLQVQDQQFDAEPLGYVKKILEDGSTLIEAKLTSLIEYFGEDRFLYLLKRGLEGGQK